MKLFSLFSAALTVVTVAAAVIQRDSTTTTVSAGSAGKAAVDVSSIRVLNGTENHLAASEQAGSTSQLTVTIWNGKQNIGLWRGSELCKHSFITSHVPSDGPNNRRQGL